MNKNEYVHYRHEKTWLFNEVYQDTIDIGPITDIRIVMINVLTGLFAKYSLVEKSNVDGITEASLKENKKERSFIGKANLKYGISMETALSSNFLAVCKNLAIKFTKKKLIKEIMYTDEDLIRLGIDKFYDLVYNDLEKILVELTKGELS
jgi:hypothetical protein